MRLFFSKILAIGGTVAAFLFAGAGEARAEYCREYTRTVYIGSNVQEAYGTACLQPDGSWMIVGEGPMNSIPDNASNVDYVIRDNNRTYVPSRVVYYDQPQIRVYKSRPAPIFVWNQRGHYHGNKYVAYNKSWRNDRHDRYDRNDHRWDRGRDDRRGHGHR